MRLTRLVLPVLLGLTLAGCSDSGSSDSSDGTVDVSEVGAEFTFRGVTVAEGWTMRPVERSVAMETTTSPEIRGEATNDGDEPAYALFEMVFAADGTAVTTVRCSSKEMKPGASADLLCPGLGQPMPKDYDQIVVQEITR